MCAIVIFCGVHWIRSFFFSPTPAYCLIAVCLFAYLWQCIPWSESDVDRKLVFKAASVAALAASLMFSVPLGDDDLGVHPYARAAVLLQTHMDTKGCAMGELVSSMRHFVRDVQQQGGTDTVRLKEAARRIEPMIRAFDEGVQNVINSAVHHDFAARAEDGTLLKAMEFQENFMPTSQRFVRNAFVVGYDFCQYVSKSFGMGVDSTVPPAGTGNRRNTTVVEGIDPLDTKLMLFDSFMRDASRTDGDASRQLQGQLTTCQASLKVVTSLNLFDSLCRHVLPLPGFATGAVSASSSALSFFVLGREVLHSLKFNYSSMSHILYTENPVNSSRYRGDSDGGKPRIPSPVAPETAPVEAEPVPVAPEPTPVEAEPVPVAPETVPVEAEPVPVAPEPTPVEAEPVPVAHEPTPVEAEPTPVEAVPVPVVPESVPVDAEPVPVVPEPMPVKVESVPVVSEPVPVKVEPVPVVSEPMPVKVEPMPVVPEIMPVKVEPMPVVPEIMPVKVEPVPVVPETMPVKVEPVPEPMPVKVEPVPEPMPVKVEPVPESMPVKVEPVQTGARKPRRKGAYYLGIPFLVWVVILVAFCFAFTAISQQAREVHATPAAPDCNLKPASAPVPLKPTIASKGVWMYFDPGVGPGGFAPH